MILGLEASLKKYIHIYICTHLYTLNIHLGNEHRINNKNFNLHTANNKSGRMISSL